MIKEKIKKLLNNEKFWYRVGIFDIILGLITNDLVLIILGIGLIYLNRKQRENPNENK